MYVGFGKTTVARWNKAWSAEPGLWQWSDRITAEAHARLQPTMTYVVEVTAEGYRPFFGTLSQTHLFEELTA